MKSFDKRHKKILQAIIESHIDLNSPIGSYLITKKYPLGLSPATVRNIMASLEKMGYIHQPHTSAGRVPTEKGYQFYVNGLLKKKAFTLNTNLLPSLFRKLRNSEEGNSSIIREATKTLSHLSQYMALAIQPKAEDLVLRHIKFLRYESRKIISVFISEDGTIKHTLIDLEMSYTQKHLDQVASYLNNTFCGFSLSRIKEQLSLQLSKEKAAYDTLLQYLFNFFDDVDSREDVDISFLGFSGTSYLPDFVGLKQIKQILKAIEDKDFILKLLHHIGNPRDIQVFVGMESIMPAMKEMSMVVSRFSDKKNSDGAIGIIGPTRMNYVKLIPIVNHTAKALTQLLSVQ